MNIHIIRISREQKVEENFEEIMAKKKSFQIWENNIKTEKSPTKKKKSHTKICYTQTV